MRIFIFVMIGVLMSSAGFSEQSSLVVQQGHSDEILFVSVDPLGRTYATASRDKTVKVWDIRSGKLIRTMTGFSFYVSKVAYSPEGGYLYMRGDLGTCYVYSTQTWEERTSKFYDDFFPITQLNFGVNDDMLLFGNKGSAFMVNTKTWSKHLLSSRVPGEVDHIVFDPATKKVTVRAKGGNPSEIDVSNILQKENFSTGRIPSEHYPYKAELRPGGVEIYGADGDLLAVRKQPKVSVPSNAVFSPDNSMIAICFEEMDDVMLWSLRTNAMIRIPVGEKNTRAMQFSSDGKRIYIACGTTLKSFFVDGSEDKSLFSSSGKISAIGITQDHKLMVAGTDDGMLSVFDLLQNKVLSTFKIGKKITSLSVHPKGKQVAVAEDGHVTLFKLPALKEDKVLIKGNGTRSTDFSDDGKFLMAQDAKTKRVMLYETGKDEPSKSFRDPSEHKTRSEAAIQKQLFPVAFSNKKNYMISMGEEWVMHLRNVSDGKATELKGHSSWANSFCFSSDDRFLISTSDDGSVRLWDVASGMLRGTMVFNEHDFVVALADNYYFTSKGGYDMVGFYKDGKVYPFEQFDVVYNRPDKVLQGFGSDNTMLITAFTKACEKRIEKLGLRKVSALGIPPDVTILNRDKIGIKTRDKAVKLNIAANGKDAKLDRVLVWINDVAVWGKKGFSLRGNNLTEWKKEIVLPLAQGTNVIDVAVMNESGIESHKERIITEYEEAVKTRPVLYFAGIGSSRFKNGAFNLTYPAKDVNDLNTLLQTFNGSVFAEVKSMVFTDERVSSSMLKEIRRHFSTAGRNDVVLLFFAGHGVLDPDFNYYLSAYDMDFNTPAKGGIEYTEMEMLLDSIVPLKKLFLIDACHSGELDRDDYSLAENANTEKNEYVSFRNVGSGIVKKEGIGLKSTSELLKELFADLRRGTGATVISSAGGAEYAMESDAWKNGLFSYCLLEGLKEKSADSDHDGKISVSELLQYVTLNVTKLSGGKQNPSSRAENISLDFYVR